MKVLLCISLIYLATVFSYHTADSVNQRSDGNLITSAEHSREDHHEYDAFEREARRKYEHQKSSSDTFKRIPAIRRTVPEDNDHHHEDTEHGTNSDSGKRLRHEDYSDSDRSSFADDRDSDDHVDYHHQEEYPELPIQPPSAPPVVFFGPQQPIGRRQIRLPVYRRPSYSRLYDAGPLPVSYRAINPVAYSVPTRVRNVVLGYPSALSSPVRYAYSPPSPALDAGVVPLEYRGYIAEEYDEFLKKK
ncbi:uncharacterized protein LOC129947340 [Eupeodes corollae]|uniref:uncharacterized protein LOC129947340 n=1 Tax=Eupeodes corollae TaxID=290404 RepID=UPI0024938AC8|nr:uncharacterized protein LOC129947340 [Eupeodes corollae]